MSEEIKKDIDKVIITEEDILKCKKLLVSINQMLYSVVMWVLILIKATILQPKSAFVHSR